MRVPLLTRRPLALVSSLLRLSSVSPSFYCCSFSPVPTKRGQSPRLTDATSSRTQSDRPNVIPASASNLSLCGAESRGRFDIGRLLRRPHRRRPRGVERNLGI